LRYGCAKKGSPKLLAQIEAMLGKVPVLALDVPADAATAASGLNWRPLASLSVRMTYSSPPTHLPSERF
jgi:hypothetical protein